MFPQSEWYKQFGKIVDFFISIIKKIKGDVATNIGVDAFYFFIYLMYATVLIAFSSQLKFKYKDQMNYALLILGFLQVSYGSIRSCQKFIHDKLRSNV